MVKPKALYTLDMHQNSVIHIYARNPEDIIEAVECYRSNFSLGLLRKKNMPECIREGASLDDVIPVKNAVITYQYGWINLTHEDPFEDIGISKDFVLRINPESVETFEYMVDEMMKKTYGKLHYFACLSCVFGGVYFLPEDIATRMNKLDLSAFKRYASRQAKDACAHGCDGSQHVSEASSFEPRTPTRPSSLDKLRKRGIN